RRPAARRPPGYEVHLERLEGFLPPVQQRAREEHVEVRGLAAGEVRSQAAPPGRGAGRAASMAPVADEPKVASVAGAGTGPAQGCPGPGRAPAARPGVRARAALLLPHGRPPGPRPRLRLGR